MINKLLTTLLFLLSALTTWAQIAVTEFKLDREDITALHSAPVLDQNGYKCALIRVQTTQDGFVFDTGRNLPPEKIDYSPVGEVWVYVPYGVRQIMIAHPQLGRMDEWYTFPVPIEKACTYVMKLTTGQVKTIVKNVATSQFVVFKLSEPNGMIDIDGRTLAAKDSTAQDYFKFGTYPYTVSLANYHQVSGTVVVNDPMKKHVIPVKLLPAFGWIDIRSNQTTEGASVFIDDAPVGSVPMKTANLASGVHHVKIVNKLYKNWDEEVEVKDATITTLTPQMVPNFANVVMTVSDSAEIWVNGELKGRSRWSGKLEAKDYLLETKAVHHRTYSENRTIEPSSTTLNISLPAPTPIKGSLKVNVSPAFADIYISTANS